MKTLVEQCQQLSADMDRIANREGDSEIVKSLTAVTEAIEEHVTWAQALTVNVRAMSGNSALSDPGWVAVGSAADLQKRIDAVKRRLAENRGDLRKGNTWANCDTEAKGLTQSLARKLEGAWKKFIGGLTVDTASFSTFRHVPACKVALRKVDELNGKIRSREATLPITRKEVSEAVTLSAEARALIDSLNLGDVPKEVQALLKDAASGRARLADLSDKALEWLRDHKQFIAGLRITASSD